MKDLNLFHQPEHVPFLWNGGTPAALLVHGFPGTPAELRPLAQTLHQAGWTTQGLLLPGFGQEIDTLFERSHADWQAALAEALDNLRQKHSPLLLVGYSMGAALSLQVAANQPPDGLVLLAPFRQLGSSWQRLVGTLLKPFFKEVRPFKNVNFDDKNARRELEDFFVGADLSDPTVQQTIQNLSVPTRLFDELNTAGRKGYLAANNVTVPTLMLHGCDDPIVSRRDVRRLRRRLATSASFVELDAGHDLLKPELDHWATLRQSVLEFAETLLPQPVNAKE